jgi:transposase-like protein
VVEGGIGHEHQTVCRGGVLGELGDAGAKVVDLCRKYGMSDATYYNW